MKSLKSSPKIYPYEWLIVCLFCGSIIGLSVYSWWMKEVPYIVELGEEGWMKSSSLTIGVNGAVLNPGEYQIERGKKVKDILEWAKPLDDADLSKVKLEAVLKPKQRIRIPFKSKTRKKP